MNNLERILTGTYKMKEREERITDKNICDYYLKEISNGNYAVLNQAQKFTEDTYSKYKQKDIVVVTANTNAFPSDLDAVTQLQVNLNALKRIIAEIEVKEDMKEQDKR